LLFIIYIFAAKEYQVVEQTTPPGSIVAKKMEVERKPLPGVLNLEPKINPDEIPTISDLPKPGKEPESAPAQTPPEAAVKSEEPVLPVIPAQPEAPRHQAAEPPAIPIKPAPPEAPQPKAAEPPARPAVPIPPPLPPAAEKMVSHPVKGEAFTRALIKIMDDQVNKPIFGWRPNSILFGKMGLTDNVNNLQLGVLEIARRTVVVLNDNMSRFALTEAQNPYLNNAMNFFMVSPEKYWFPSASGKYKEAMANLEQYIDDLKHNRSHFYTRVDNLIALMNHFRDVLGSAFHNLIKDTETDGSKVSYLVTDDYFYFAQGIALGMAEILEGVKEDFADQLARKNSSKLVDDAIHALHTGTQLHPWVVTNAAKDGILANHRANMGTYIGEAEHVISTLVTVLATN
jgi:Uncharacterized protein conserved in bacteria (DUF2333)